MAISASIPLMAFGFLWLVQAINEIARIRAHNRYMRRGPWTDTGFEILVICTGFVWFTVGVQLFAYGMGEL